MGKSRWPGRWIPMVLVAHACGDGRGAMAPGVPESLARERAERIADLEYDIHFDIPAVRDEPIAGRLIARLTLSDAQAPIVFDFTGPPESVRDVRVDGVSVGFDVRDEHVVVAPRALRAGLNAVEIVFRAGDGSLNRQDDFLYSLFVPDRARVAFPVFDQPNLKARYTLTLDVPAEWRAVSNGSVERRRLAGDRAEYVFAQTAPISSYLFSFVAGRFEVEEAERHGRTMRMYHRETDTASVRRNREAVFDLHATALEWLETYTEIPYPFEKFDFVLIPSFQYGGMEHPGAILYRQASLFLDETATQNQRLGRASLIAHETAHMWFGDLVTMEWFDDVWTKEVFANFMAAKIVNPSFPDLDHDLRFLHAHYPAAYAVDRTEGANPIRQPLDNLAEAGTLYGAIIYQKAPIVMRHLERMIGEEPFRDGLREYLTTFAFGNASWPALIEILDRRSDADLDRWSTIWVHEPERPTVRVDLEVADDVVTALHLRQFDPADRGRRWQQRLHVRLGYPGGRSVELPVRLTGDAVEVPEAAGLAAPAYVLPNGRGIGYGEFVLDPASFNYLLDRVADLEEASTRGIVWLTLWDAMLRGGVSPTRLLREVERGIAAEPDELNVDLLLGFVEDIFWRYLSDDERAAVAARVEETLWTRMQRASAASLKAALFASYRDIALTEEAQTRLRGVWTGERTIPGLTLGENDVIALAASLALRRPTDTPEILASQRERIENPDRLRRFTFVMPALSLDPAIRRGFFADLADPAYREREAWVLDGLRFLHHPLHAHEVEDLLRPSLDLLEEIQRTGDIFFPQRWLAATLSGHRSPSAAATVRQFLADRPDLPGRLRGKVLQAADPLFRAVAIDAGPVPSPDEGP